jgi:hypothetical protein
VSRKEVACVYSALHTSSVGAYYGNLARAVFLTDVVHHKWKAGEVVHRAFKEALYLFGVDIDRDDSIDT